MGGRRRKVAGESSVTLSQLLTGQHCSRPPRDSQDAAGKVIVVHTGYTSVWVREEEDGGVMVL